MREQSYQRRLVRDLEKWVNQGRITKDTADDIISEFPSSGLSDRLPSIIAVLGAVLICFGILAFVAANWYGVSKAVRLALLAVGMWTAYGVAGILYKRGSLWLFEAVVLIGVSIYATSIVLIAQMYHIDGHYPDGIFMAGAGALIAAALVRSDSALIIAIGMITLWTSMEILEFDVIFHWPFIFAWGALVAVSFYLKSRMGYHLITLSFAYWITLTVFMQADANIVSLGGAVSLLASIAFIVLAIALVFAHHSHKTHPDSYALPLCHYAIMALVTLIFLVQINETGSSFFSAETSQPFVLEIIWLTGSALLIAAGIGISIFWRNKTNYTASDIAGLILIGMTTLLFSIIGADNLLTAILLAVAVFLISLWLITYGQGFADRTFVNLGFVLFGAETLYIYFKTFGTLMNSFVFFTIGGIVLILLALGLERFRKRILNTPSEPGVSVNA